MEQVGVRVVPRESSSFQIASIAFQLLRMRKPKRRSIGQDEKGAELTSYDGGLKMEARIGSCELKITLKAKGANTQYLPSSPGGANPLRKRSQLPTSSLLLLRT